VAIGDETGAADDAQLHPPARNVIVVDDQLSIPRSELEVKTSRSSGAGGQHVNKTSSRVEITWNVALSPSLTDEQRQVLTGRLASRLSLEGAIRVVASDTRSQLRNREHAEARLIDMVKRGLTVPKRRRATKPPRSANQARLTVKKKQSDKKRERQRPAPE